MITINSDTTIPYIENNNNDKVDNPQMGINYPIIILSIVLLGGITIMIYTRKNNKNEQ